MNPNLLAWDVLGIAFALYFLVCWFLPLLGAWSPNIPKEECRMSFSEALWQMSGLVHIAVALAGFGFWGFLIASGL